MQKTAILFAIATLLGSCGTKQQQSQTSFYVSILPLRSIVEQITEEDFPIEVLVPAGASPESFEPTPKQFVALAQAQRIFSVGLLDFESALLSKLEAPERIVNLSKGITPIAGSCSHSNHGTTHAHGIDPHIWTSPRGLRLMAANAYRAIHALYPDSTRYTANFERLDSQLQALDTEVASQIAASGLRYFIIYHPALTYYARDYGIHQVAIEADGKEPSARRLADIIRQGREDGVQRILYQSQYPVAVVETIARDLGATAVEIDPLREDAIQNLRDITHTLTQQ